MLGFILAFFKNSLAICSILSIIENFEVL